MMGFKCWIEIGRENMKEFGVKVHTLLLFLRIFHGPVASSEILLLLVCVNLLVEK